MSVYCRLGSGLWTWEPWTNLDPTTRILWLGLYSSSEAKRLVPGLWHGSIGTMADAARLPADDVVKSLDRLLEDELVEYDRKLRVARLTELPDAGESPSSGNVIRGWYTKFRSIPACQVRDAHVPTLRWILEEWCRENGKSLSADHQKAWAETFGDSAKITIPPPRKRGVRRLSASQAAQGDLFDTLREPSVSPSERDSVDNSDSLHQPKEISESETLSKGFRNPLDQDQDPDQDQVSGSPDPEGESLRGGRPTLRLVPPPAYVPFTVEQLQAVLVPRGLRLSESQRAALGDAIRYVGEIPQGEKTLELVDRWLKLRVDEAVVPGKLREAICRARQLEAEAEERSQALREEMAAASLATGNGGGETVH